VRELNEDAYCVLLPPHVAPGIDALLAVADGMGGHQAGEVASGYVVKTLEHLFSSSIYRQWVDHSPLREDYYAVVLKEVLERINDHLYTQASTNQSLSGMGTTATVALLAGGRLFIGHVGDSRAYLLRKGKIKRLTHDHTWVEEKLQAGKITPHEAESHPHKNILTRALGNSLIVRIDRSIHSIQPNDILILCTDGLTNLVSDAELSQIIQANQDPQRACDFLIDLANRRGGTDNITVLISRLTSKVSEWKKPQLYHEVKESKDTQKILLHG